MTIILRRCSSDGWVSQKVLHNEFLGKIEDYNKYEMLLEYGNALREIFVIFSDGDGEGEEMSDTYRSESNL